MSNNITINTNQNPYFDDFDEDKNFHQVLYKPSLPVQARELSTQQSILRNQVKSFGDHIFKNGSKVTGGDLVLNLDYEYVKLKPQYNGVNIDIAGFSGKTIVGALSGSKALILGFSEEDTNTGDPDTVYVKYITGGSVTNSVQGINVTNGGNGYTVTPSVIISGGGGTGAEAEAVISSGQVVAVNVTNRGTGYTSNPTALIQGGNGGDAELEATRTTQPRFLAGERIYSTDLSISADVVDATPTSIQFITITKGGSGYTEPPNVSISDAPTGGVNATASATIDSGIVTEIIVTNQGSGYTEIPTVTIDDAPAGGVNATADAVFSVAAGLGSSASIAEGVFYINGNFVKVPQQTLLLDKYFDKPTYRVGLSALETIVNSGDDGSLLDNSQGSSNFAAPGADRLKITLTLTKKRLESTDDEDFYELLRVNEGFKEQDIKVPVYSVLEDTFARRTFDESGSYTVRSFNIQLRDDPDDDSKFIVRLDPGKAFIEGLEYETLVSSDIKLDKARETVNVSGFDRLMQYGNYVVVKDLNGLFDISENRLVDLHNVIASQIDRTDETTYASTKIGEARVRSIDFNFTDNENAGNLKYNIYLYEIRMLNTASATNQTFATLESVVVRGRNNATNVLITPPVLEAIADIDDAGKISVQGPADPNTGQPTVVNETLLLETSDNSLVFKLPQDTIQTIRGLNNVIDTDYTIKKVFENQSFSGGVGNLSSAGAAETFVGGTGVGSGAVSSSVARENYLVVVTNPQSSGRAVGSIVRFDVNGTSINVQAPQNTTAQFITGNSSDNFIAAVIATLNVSGKQERIKSLTYNETVTFTTPSNSSEVSQSLDKSDAWKIKAIYDSGDTNTDPVLPTLIVADTADTLTVGETITGQTSGATGTVVKGLGGETTITFIPESGTFEAENITGAVSGFTKVSSSVSNIDNAFPSKNIISDYDFNTGQLDSLYDYGSVKLKTGAAAPSGQITVVFDFFTHTGVGYLSVDSYTGAIDFKDIPKYQSPVSGVELELRDCIDFRPRRSDSNPDVIENIELPVPNSNWQADFSYFLPRTDTVYLSRERKFGSNKGISALTTVAPTRLDGTMNLYTLFIPAFTFSAKDVRAEYIENKRYTMRDIGKIEKRLSNVEYYTSLSLLEKDAEDLTIRDVNGLDRFKNGILVDGFNGHSVGNVLTSDYQCAIDFDEKTLRCRFASNITDLHYNASLSTGVRKTGDLITLPYDSRALISQPIASKSINVNPFAVLAWVGSIDLTPPSDNWVDTNTNPEVIVNLQGENDAWESLVGLSFGTQFNDWQTFGTGRETVLASRGGRRGNAITVTQTVRRDTIETRTGIRNEITGSDAVRNSIGDRVVDVSVIPFIRPRPIVVSVRGMKPNTLLYARFDGEDVTQFCIPDGAAVTGPINTDNAGSVTFTFNIPNTDDLRFRTGERQFLLTDNPSGDLITAGTYGEVVYQAQGLLQTRENVVVSTRVPRIQQFAQGSATEFRTTTNTFNRVNVVGFVDPLAETFLVDPALYPDGVFLTDVELFFKTKDEDGLPVTLQIRDTLNGYPAQTIVPFSDISKSPDDVNVSDDATVATKFEFPSLVYLQPGEYSIVILSNSLKYEAFIAELGENRIGTDRKISEQPYAGVFFKSQNASTWSPDQNQDLTFNINIAEFATGSSANAVFTNVNPNPNVISNPTYRADILQLVPQEIRVNKTNIAWGIKTRDAGSDTFDVDYRPLIQNTNFWLDQQKHITNTPNRIDFQSRAQLVSDSRFITPVIDCQRNSVITVENLINDDALGEEDIASGGNAIARYISRRVTLKDGFDATSIQVFLTANRPPLSKILVYYKVLSQFDTALFDDRPWVLMDELSNTSSVSANTDDNEYLELEFCPRRVGNSTDIDYLSDGVTYDSFKTFAIKIVMTSARTTRVPLVKDLRAIALA
jgi:hypothetical protein